MPYRGWGHYAVGIWRLYRIGVVPFEPSQLYWEGG